MKEQLYIMIDPGSTSTKYSIYSKNDPKINNINTSNSNLKQSKYKLILTVQNTKSQSSIAKILKENKINYHNALIKFGIRVVAPGLFFTKNQLINEQYLTRLQQIQHLAPLHIKPVLLEIKKLQILFPKSQIFACSDSNFHISIPDYAKSYAIPSKISKQKELYRFGYHGLALQSATSILKSKKQLKKKIIICHLGGGSSVTAILNGKSVDTSMGFSPLEGIMGASRSGSIDPTVILQISQNKNLTFAETINFLNTKCGFKALIGTTNIKQVLKNIKNKKYKNKTEQNALDLYIHQIQKAIGASIATLNGVDLIVFTGGIGEGSALIRKLICKKITFVKPKMMNIKIDETSEMLKVCTDNN